MQQQWWHSAVAYQIYPKSFLDSNNDGYGDLGGILAKLDYIKNLGVDIIWLTPIYASPQADNGYDISDYYAIDPRSGTLDQFKLLIEQIHQRQMYLIMDMVVNHTSTEHAWFKQACSSTSNYYHDFYIWQPVATNWLSKFGGSAWQYYPPLNKYYLHLFSVQQADLNWRNPELRQAIYCMMDYWLDLGVDGFRLDVINLIAKPELFSNDTLSNTADGRRFYTDLPEAHQYLHEMRQQLGVKHPNLFLVGELSSTSLTEAIAYTQPARQELDMIFNFHHLKLDYLHQEKWSISNCDFIALKQIFNYWQCGMQQQNAWHALFWSNHDQARALSRFGDELNYPYHSATMLATALYLMRGTPFIYQGEELGMTNAHFTKLSQYRDIESLNAASILLTKSYSISEVLAILAAKSRDNARTPMQWDNTQYAGFSSIAPWIDVNTNYLHINAGLALQQADSIYNYYKQLSNLRKTYSCITTGTFKLYYAEHKALYVYTRSLPSQLILLVNNFSGEQQAFTMPDELKHYSKITCLINNYKELNYCMLHPYQSCALLLEE